LWPTGRRVIPQTWPARLSARGKRSAVPLRRIPFECSSRSHRPARFEGLVIAQVLALGVQVPYARVGAAPPASGEPGGISLGGDGGGGPVAAVGQDEGYPSQSPGRGRCARPGGSGRVGPEPYGAWLGKHHHSGYGDGAVPNVASIHPAPCRLPCEPSGRLEIWPILWLWFLSRWLRPRTSCRQS
jgi:hypothetical protein